MGVNFKVSTTAYNQSNFDFQQLLSYRQLQTYLLSSLTKTVVLPCLSLAFNLLHLHVLHLNSIIY